ncbi:EthD domain-containing protein [Pseudomonas sp.]|uniref:EthD domain-containing protein n=1 Tax=Pseudomonas sp. TaxID=306 RepID=UPI0026019A46|nr:EthD domain-containing protein [Pseudomonas sp.]
MLKFIIAFERHTKMTREECQSYLNATHGPLVSRVTEFSRHVQGYVQNFTFDGGIANGTGFDIDGASELWFADLDTFSTAFSESRYLELIRPDELRFANPERLIMAFTTEETVISKQRPTALKLFRFLGTPQGGEATAMRTAWQVGYGKQLVQDEALASLVVRYVQNWSLPIDRNPFPLSQSFTGVDELWFESDEELVRFITLEQKLLNELSNQELIDMSASVAFVAVEKAVMPVAVN